MRISAGDQCIKDSDQQVEVDNRRHEQLTSILSSSATVFGDTTRSMASPPSSSKMHASPSKGASSSAALTSTNRTYDAKLVQREMLRLGTLAGHLPAVALSTITTSAAALTGSAGTLMLPNVGASAAGAAGSVHGHGHALGHGGSTNVAASGNDGGAWAQLHVYVLPLFNHEQLQFPIEDLNALVRQRIDAVMSAAPSRALATLETDVAELIGAGMTTLNTKLAGVEDDKLPARVVELWAFFWDHVLPYVEGVFIPLSTDSNLLKLHRTPKPHRPASPTMLVSPDDTPSGVVTSSPIDVRTIALRLFRDKIIVPVASRLEARLISMRPGASFSSSTSVPGINSVAEASSYQHPRLQQMLLVLHSQAQRARPALSLTAPVPTLSPQELTIRRLLDALAAYRAAASGSSSARNSRTGAPLNPPRHSRAPSFLSGGAPRDRRGRIGIGLNTLNSLADSDKENVKRQARYIDDTMLPASGPSDYGVGLPPPPSSHARRENGVGNLSLDPMRRPWNLDGDAEEEAEQWELAYGRSARTAGIGHWGSGAGSWDGGTTPRGRSSAERERDRSFLESLRSPNPIDSEQGSPYAPLQDGWMETNANMNTINSIIRKREDSLPTAQHPVFSSTPPSRPTNGTTNGVDEQLDWDSAQAVVERMLGMGNTTPSADSSLALGHMPSPAPLPPPPLTAPGPMHVAGQGPGPPMPDPRRRRMT